MLEIKEKRVQVADKELIFKSGEYALQANGSITLTCGETVVQGICTMGDENPDLDFFPLTVEYNENLYAGGLIKSNRFMKRSGRPSDEAILKCRLIDRSIRPMFPKDFKREVQVVINVLASDKENPHDVLGLTAAIVALAVSDIPFDSNLSGLRVSKVGDELVVNPTYEQCKEQAFELVLAGNDKKIVMIESAANCVHDDEVIKGFEAAYGYLGQLAQGIKEFQDEAGKEKVEFTPKELPAEIHERIKDLTLEKVEEFYQKLQANEIDRTQFKEVVQEPILALFTEDELENTFQKKHIIESIDKIFKKEVRRNVLEKQRRLDGRPIDKIREIVIKTNVLPRVHGSSMFMRGETQVLSILTLAAPGREQILEAIEGEGLKSYIHHYSAPPYSVGEVGRMGGAGRREIGHGALAEKALLPVIPKQEDFSYVILLNSEVMGQNGSSSMASTCASSVTLMLGGIPIKEPVAGISIGLMTGEDDSEFVTLTDIQGTEDFSGDMDFKVAGTRDAITAIQMDTKIKGLTIEIVRQSIKQAKDARIQLLDMIEEAIPVSERTMSKYAPKIVSMTVPVDSISKVIGSGGKVIKQISADCDVDVSINDDGSVFISGTDDVMIEKAQTIVNGIVSDPEVGAIYKGKIVKILDFGAIVQIFPGKEGLIHISRISKERIKDVQSVLSVGQEVEVKLFEIDNMRRLNFSMNLDEEVQENSGRKNHDRHDRHERPRKSVQTNRRDRR